ncbi:UNVERIFIED_ORG: ABC-2 type transport system permease protein [Peribacillus simplex]
MNMFLHELKVNRKSTIIWTLSLVAIAVLFLSIFPTIEREGEEFKKVLASYPEGVLKAVGVQIDSITSFLGFYSYVFLYIMLCGAIQGMNLGMGVLSKEIIGKTAEFLLTKPVARKEILTSKALAVVTSLLITNIVFLGAAALMANMVAKESIDYQVFFMISATNFFVQLMFASFGFLLSVLVSRIKSVLPLSLSTVFAFFILYMFGSVIGEKAVRYLTPFKYFDLAYIIRHSGYEAQYIIIGSIFIVATVAVSFIVFTKKDIHTV